VFCYQDYWVTLVFIRAESTRRHDAMSLHAFRQAEVKQAWGEITVTHGDAIYTKTGCSVSGHYLNIVYFSMAVIL